MVIADFLTHDRIVLDLRARNKQLLLEELARRAAGHGLAPQTVAAALLNREQLGSTGLGKGFALPHARIAGLDHFIGMFARLARPIDYEAVDGAAVDLIFLLLMPDAEQAVDGITSVATLAAIARLFRNESTVDNLRRCRSTAEAFTIFLS